MRYTMYADGGSRGNPGPAGSGALVRDDSGKTVVEVSDYLGITTNNVAEYTGMLRALQKLAVLVGDSVSETDVLVRMDSMLVVKQMQGLYRVKHPNLVPLYRQVVEAVKPFRSVQFEHVYREDNADADRLANIAMDAGMGRI